MKQSKIDAKDILKRLENNENRAKVSLYLDKKIYDQFKKACGKQASASRVMEELMREFLESLKR